MQTRPDLQPLLDRFEQDLVLRRFRPATRRNYLLYTRLYLHSLDQPIDQIHEAELKAFLVDQIQRHRRSYEAYRQIYAALKFLFTITLGRPDVVTHAASSSEEVKSAVKTRRSSACTSPNAHGSIPGLPTRS